MSIIGEEDPCSWCAMPNPGTARRRMHAHAVSEKKELGRAGQAGRSTLGGIRRRVTRKSRHEAEVGKLANPAVRRPTKEQWAFAWTWLCLLRSGLKMRRGAARRGQVCIGCAQPSTRRILSRNTAGG